MLAKFDHDYLRPFLSKVLPPLVYQKFYSSLRPLAVHLLKQHRFGPVLVQDPLDLWGLTFRNRLGAAAGFDKDGTLLQALYRMGAGYAVVGTALPDPHGGNKGLPWVPLIHSGAAINRLGLPSPGVDRVIQNIDDFKCDQKIQNFPIGLSLMGHPKDKEDEKKKNLWHAIKKADQSQSIDFIELNISCPNVGAAPDFNDIPKQTFEIHKPLVLKLSPTGPDPKVIQLCMEDKVQGLVIGNTQKHYDMSQLSTKDQKHALAFQNNFGGGLSGKPLLKPNLEFVKQWKNALDKAGAKTYLIGCGGVFSGQDKAAYDEHCTLTQAYTGIWHVLAEFGPERSWQRLYEF